MAQTFLEVQRQIAKLQGDAEKLKQAESAGVIERIREAIRVYGFTSEDLFGNRPTPRPIVGGRPAKAKSPAKGSSKVQFADGNGNEWVGRGARPLWLREALAGGKSLSDFAVGPKTDKSAKASDDSTSSTPKAAAKRKSATVKVKYKDGEGNTWTGRGLHPRWLKAAIAEGKSIDDFLV